MTPTGSAPAERLDATQRLSRPHPVAGLLVDHADLGELVPETEVDMADPDAIGGLLLQLGRLRHQLGEVLELGVIQRDVGPVGQHDAPIAARQRGEQIRQRQSLPVDGDDDLEVQPVGPLVDEISRDRPRPRRRGRRSGSPARIRAAW